MLDAERRELLALWTDSDRRLRFITEVASGAEQVLEAMRLRHRVFVGEIKAEATSGADGIECDRFDRYCDHLIVRDVNRGRVVGAYRFIPPSRRRQWIPRRSRRRWRFAISIGSARLISRCRSSAIKPLSIHSARFSASAKLSRKLPLANQ